MGAQVMEDLVYFGINPQDNLILSPRETITFTAEGNFGTRTMPIDVEWNLIEGASLGQIGNCAYTSTCTFTAGLQQGIVILQADANNGRLTDRVQIAIHTEAQNPFSDKIPDWSKEPIIKLHEIGIIKGYDDGTYGSGDPVTNGQVVTLLYRVMKRLRLASDPVGCGEVYKDMPATHYAYLPACFFKQQGWSTSGQYFQPDAHATRATTARFVNKGMGANLLSALNVQPPTLQVFDDVPVTSSYFRDTGILNATGVMTGYPNGNFGFSDSLNRAEVATVIYRILERLE